ncbi:MAG: lysophospholipid acyltransferase family protein [Pseudomonadota bacterium]
MTGWMAVCGLKLRVEGMDKVEAAGGAILAAKHQSYGDGISLVSRRADLAYVIGDHMLRFPLVGSILKSTEAVVVDNVAGRRANAVSGFGFHAGCDRLRADQRDVLIFPEGGMSAVGRKQRYRRGVYKLYAELDRPVFPVATNLGLYWPEMEWVLHPGEARVEILDPIEPGLDPSSFMRRLEDAIETRTHELVQLGRADRARRSKPDARSAAEDHP